ncbi:MAG: hypothetical protein ABJC05_07150 [Pyrinomonadaceae bacterium]
MDRRIVKVLFVVCAVAALYVIGAVPAAAQCAMCRASVQNNAALARGLNLAVLVLLVPPVTMFGSIIILAYRRRKGGEGGEGEGTEE